MQMLDQGRNGPGVRAEGVGIAYHPFLHDALLAQADAFDFVELPLDLYIDPARSALLDPGDARLEQIIAAKPCTWRGTALSIGSVTPEPAFSPWLLDRIRHRLDQAAATSYTETIGFRSLARRDIGMAQHLPPTEAAARWIAVRHRLATEALGRPIMLQPSSASIPAPHADLSPVDFLARIAALSGCSLLIDTTDLVRMAQAAGSTMHQAARLLPASVAAASLTGTSEADWAVLTTLAEQTALRSIVLRRDRDLFPLNTIASEATRATALVAPSSRQSATPAPPVTLSAAPAGLAALHSYQVAFLDYFIDQQGPPPPPLQCIPETARDALAADVQSWRNWRMQVDDTHKTQQIADFLSRGADRRAPWTV